MPREIEPGIENIQLLPYSYAEGDSVRPSRVFSVRLDSKHYFIGISRRKILAEASVFHGGLIDKIRFAFFNVVIVIVYKHIFNEERFVIGDYAVSEISVFPALAGFVQAYHVIGFERFDTFYHGVRNFDC